MDGESFCAIPGCHQLPTGQCFQCDQPTCLLHLIPLRLSISFPATRFRVCTACARACLSDTILARIVTLETTLEDMPAPSA